MVELQLPGLQGRTSEELVLFRFRMGRVLRFLDALDGEPLQTLVVLIEIDRRRGRGQTKPASSQHDWVDHARNHASAGAVDGDGLRDRSQILGRALATRASR